MGLGGISIWQLLIVLVIILLLVGPKRLKSLGSEMGNFLKNFRKAVDDKEENQNEADK
ncbi:MAG: twin-arginine translocase TatA/TatE family subunit [SAR86 cluster bacterium]|jgi:sec-independent protein translocase protein TatA|nr:twin-arginine translocase TatA/TatE family subunit [SAR86 cluster bacterium]